MSVRPSRRRRALLGSLATVALLAGCMVNAGDAPTVDEEPNPEEGRAPASQSLKRIQVGVDAFGEGFNPHLVADASPVTDLVAQLTLPSAFEPDPADPSRWRRSPDLLESAELVPVTEPVPNEEVDPGADAGAASGIAGDARPGDTRIRYRIRSGAQWSDGTPISGSDFRYLHATLLANAGVADASAYERIRAITVSGGGRQVDVLLAGAMPEWRGLFRNLLPSHLLRPSATPFSDILDNGIPASGGRYAAQSIDVGRGEVRLVRNDRFWGETPAMTDTVIIRSVDGAVSGAEQVRAAQLQALRVRPRQTTSLTYGLVPGTVEVSGLLPRELTVHANVASPLLDDAAVRRAVFAELDVPAIASVATGRTDDLEIPAAPETSSALAGGGAAAGGRPSGSVSGTVPGSVSGMDPGLVPGATEDDPLLVGVMGPDAQALAAARAIADQLTGAGIPARVSSADDQQLAGSSLPYGEVDLVVAWGDSVNSPQQAAGRWACPAPVRRSTAPDSAAASAGGSSAAATSTSPSSTAPPGDGATAEKAAPATTARGANLSGLCDAGIDRMIADAMSGTADGLGERVLAPASSVPESLRRAVAAEAVELGIVVDRVLTVVGDGVRYDGESDPARWPDGPLIGPLMTLPEWRRVPSATTSEAATETTRAEDPGRAGEAGGAGAPDNANDGEGADGDQ